MGVTPPMSTEKRITLTGLSQISQCRLNISPLANSCMPGKIAYWNGYIYWLAVADSAQRSKM